MRRTILCAAILLAGMDCALAQRAAIPRLWRQTESQWHLAGDQRSQLEPRTAHRNPGPGRDPGRHRCGGAGIGVVTGGKIPYLASALEQRGRNAANRRTEDPEAKCFMPGVPRATYMPHPFQIVQSDTDIMMGVPVRRRRALDPPGQTHRSTGGQLDGLVQRPLGRATRWSCGHRPYCQLAGSQRQLCHRDPQGHGALYADGRRPHHV